MRALNWATGNGQISAMSLLIDKGADIDFQDNVIESNILFF